MQWKIPKNYGGILIAIIIPFIALGIQWVLWSYINPFVWFLFFPAIFFGARTGGRTGGLISTMLSAIIVWYFFIPPRLSFSFANSYNAFSIVIFLIMGYLFSDVQERLKRAHSRIQQDLKNSFDANKKISELYEKTRELDVLKSNFFANISHELRTPLTLIIGSVKKVMANPALIPETRSDLDIVERNTRFLYRHVNDLLDLSKLEAKRMLPYYSRMDISYLTNVVASQFDTLAKMREMTYTVDISETVFVQLDAEKYQRIILNLLSNAFKFTPDHGEIIITLRVEEAMIVLTVGDSGPGIPVDKRDMVFERFSQIDNHETRVYSGTGLGLAIVREFTFLLEGTVRISESPKGGALFTVRLPVTAPQGAIVEDKGSELDEDMKKQAVEAIAITGHSEEGYNASSTFGSSLILVVEDNPDMNRYISTGLAAKYRIETAFNGEEGYHKVLESNPDLILTDEMMPGTTGRQMIQNLYNNKDWVPVPIIMLTAKADDALRMEMYKAGISDFINKPFEMDELLLRIDNLIAERSRTKNALNASEKRYQLLAENVADVIWIYDFESSMLSYITPSVYQLLGYTPEEMLRKDLSVMLTPESYQHTITKISERLQDDERNIPKSYNDEMNHLRRDGTPVCVEVTSRYIRNTDNGHLEMYGVSRDITERKRVEDQLKKALAERETLLRELYHRTKNNMNVIIGILTLRALYNRNENLSEIFREIENKIRVMSLVHEKLYRSQNLSFINLQEYFEEITALLLVSYDTLENRISISTKVEPVSVSIDIAIPSGLILNELISNSIKHAFPQERKGNILIRVASIDNEIEFDYSDDGIGVPDGFDFKTQSTLGLQTIHMIAQHQLQGSIKFETKAGVRCNIRFKKDSGNEGDGK